MRTIWLTDQQHLELLKLVRRAAIVDPVTFGPVLEGVELDQTEHVDIGDEPVASRRAPRLTLVPDDRETAA